MGEKLDHVFKILLIGDTGVGKSRYIAFDSINNWDYICEFFYKY